jgi:gliding motility-associatede transport system auxiliary component
MLNRIIGFIGWLGFAAVLGALALKYGSFNAKPEYGTYLAYAGLVCLLIYILGQWRDIAKMFSGRQARYGALTLVSVLIVLGILVAINYIGARQNKRWDLTANQVFSLSDQTRGVLQKLDAPLKITVFEKDENASRFRDRLKEYEYASKNVSIDYVDPDKKPAIASQNQIQQYGTILFNYKNRSERITTDSEQDITAAIIKVVQGQQKKVYFTQGHGEKDPTSSERDGFKAIADTLSRENYTVDKVVLAQSGSVPDDAAVVIVAGPKVDFLSGEIDAIKKYLDKSGKVLLMLDPQEKANSPALTNLIALARDWGVDVGNNIVVDVSGMGQLIGTSESVPVAAPPYPSHAITARFNFLTAYPLARSAEPVSGGVNGHMAQGFVQTSPRSWAESDVKGLLESGKVTFNAASGDKQGPITIASAVSSPSTAAPAAGAAADAPKPETRVAVFGDSDFAGNAGLGIQGNRDLFMNTVGWLSQQENLISIRAKEPSDRRVNMTAAQINMVTLLSLFVIPALVFAAGAYNWWRRR